MKSSSQEYRRVKSSYVTQGQVLKNKSNMIADMRRNASHQESVTRHEHMVYNLTMSCESLRRV